MGERAVWIGCDFGRAPDRTVIRHGFELALVVPDGVTVADLVVADGDDRPYMLDTENRRWFLDGSGDVA